MNKMNTKMKVLSLALLGLGGFALAGTAAAACPTAPDAWSSTSTLGGSLVVSDGGLDGSACKLDASMVVDGPGSAFVRDNSPATEPSYRAQFLVDLDALGGLNTIETFKLFGATTDTVVSSIGDLVRLGVMGNLSGTQNFLDIRAACSGETGNICTATAPLTAGVNTIEIQWVKGSGASADGTVNVWVNNNTEGTPTLTIAANNGAWSGVDYATLGISNPSPGFRAGHLNQVVSVDSFDSRRTTFIGF